MKNLEFRQIQDFKIEEGKISGKAICFNQRSKFMGFYETVKPEACTRNFLDKQDLYILFNHDESKVLGRRRNGKGNLSFDVREDGVYIECDLLDNTVTRDAKSYIDAGLCDGMSFAFVVDDEKDMWYRDADGVINREIGGFDMIHEVSVVFNPAYAQTEVQTSCRSYDKFLKEEEERKTKEEELEREYKEYTNKINEAFKEETV